MTVDEIRERLLEAQLQAHILAMAVEPGELQGRLESMAATLSKLADHLEDNSPEQDQLDAAEGHLGATTALLDRVAERVERAVQTE